MKKHVIAFEPSGLRISVNERETVLNAIRNTGLIVDSECGGKGTCGKCMVILQPSPIPEPAELKHLSDSEIERGYRLACQHHAKQDLRVRIPSLQSDTKILALGQSVTDHSDIDSGLANQLGVALDLGTTTIVGYLVDLGTGVQLGYSSSLNPQVIYGEDVITRITYAVIEDGGAEKLSDIVVREIEVLISKIIEEAKAERNRLSRLTIVGNTAMHHLFLRADVQSLGRSPYEPSIRAAITTTGEKVGLDSLPKTNVYFPPNVAGFVGSDIIGFILSQRLDLTKKVILGIDIGTNGEIVLSNRGELYCCSTAAGSAFEGATISHGMRGKNGAIEYISIEDVDEPPEISVIGNSIPQGLCGSAIVDVVSEMNRTGLLDSSGRIQQGSRRISEERDIGANYLIASKEESGAKRDITFSQKDVRQVQLAKGAIYAGSAILMSEVGLDTSEIDTVMLAGAFGSYIRPRSALGIGLLPRIEIARIIQVGNAAGEGAKTLLLSSKKRKLADELVAKIHYIELAGHDKFQSAFLESLRFPELPQE